MLFFASLVVRALACVALVVVGLIWLLIEVYKWAVS